MARGAMLEAWVRLYLFYLSERGTVEVAANALLSDLASIACSASPSSAKELRRLGETSFRTSAFDAKGHAGITELRNAVDYLFLPASDCDGESAFASIHWDCGVSPLELLHRLTELGRALRFDDKQILDAWKSRIRAARDCDALRFGTSMLVGEPVRPPQPGNQRHVQTIIDNYAKRYAKRYASITELELELRDDHRALTPLASRMHDEADPYDSHAL